jgi:hypothetical protein
MDVLASLMRTLIGVPLLLYAPGLLLDRVWLRSHSLSGVERHVNRVVASVLITGWLALLLAEFGVFSLWLLVGIVVALCAALVIVARRNGIVLVQRNAPLGIVADRGSLADGTITRSLLHTLRFDYVLLLIALIFGVLVAQPFELARGGLDAGVYANTGIAIARTGGIVQHDPLIAEIGLRAAAGEADARQFESNVLGIQESDRYIATRLRAAGFLIHDGDLAEGRVVPQFFHLWPTWIAIFVSMLGPIEGLVATGGAGLLGVVLLGLIGRRLGGPIVGVLAAAFLALMTPQVWFSRMPVSEAFSQALLLIGLWAWTHFADATKRRDQIWWGAIVGAAFGQMTLTHITGVFAPVIGLLIVGYMLWTRRAHAGYRALGAVLGVALLHVALHIAFISRAYFFDTAYARLQDFAITIYLSLPLLSHGVAERFTGRYGSQYSDPYAIWIELFMLLLAIGALAILWRKPGVLLLIEQRAIMWRRSLLGAIVIMLGALAFYGYLIRPEIITADALLNPLQPENSLRLQGYVGAPIEVPLDKYCNPGEKCKETEYIALGNMARFGWYLSPPGVLLGVIGGLLLWWRLDRRSWLLLGIATLYALFFFRSLYGTGEQTYIYILRRYVPIVYPAFALGMAVALWGWGRWARGWGRWSTARSIAAVGLSAALLLFFVVTGRNVYAHTEYEGAFAQIGALSEQIGSRDVVLVRGGGRDTSDLVATPLTYVYGLNALPVKGAQPAHYAGAFSDQVDRWREKNRRVFALLGANGGDMMFPGYTLRSVGTWTLTQREFQQLQNQKPKLSYVSDVPYQLYELVPAAETPATNTITPRDTAAQVRGFWPSEANGRDQTSYAWTDGLGILRLPADAQDREIVLALSGGDRPQAIGAANVCVDVVAEPVPHPNGGVVQIESWQALGCFDVDETTTDIPITIPQLNADSLLVRLRSTNPWTPATTEPDPGDPRLVDERRLGVRFEGVRGITEALNQ